MYSYIGPLLYIPLLRQAKLAGSSTNSFKLAVLKEVKNKPLLTEVTGKLQSAGSERLVIGS